MLSKFHLALAQHFQQDAESRIRIYVEGYGDIISLYPSGIIKRGGFNSNAENLKIRYGMAKDASDEDLLRFFEEKTSILIRIKPPGVVCDTQPVQ